MPDIRAVNDRVVEVDLTSGNIETIHISDEERRLYLGGKGLALKLIYDKIKTGIDPLSPENIIVMMTGPTLATPAPAGGRFAVVSKSPLTGIFASSFTGGRFGYSLKKAGFDGIIVRGKASYPVYIKINNGEVSIENATSLWGMDTYDLQDSMKDEGDWMTIGPAGENLVRFASIAAGRRMAGRCGLGAVMGSKNLKGIVSKGITKVVPRDPDLFNRAVRIAHKKTKNNDMTGNRLKYMGTPQGVMIYGTHGIMPVKNFSLSRFDKVRDLSGERLKEEFFIKNHGCIGCPIQCGKIGNYDSTIKISPEYETLGLMGSNLMVGDVNHIATWNEMLNRLGLDSISTGNTIGFVMELTEKGIINSSLAFGKPDGINDIIVDIAYRRGLGDEMAEGVRRLSGKYGAEGYAIQVKGLEMAAYDPRGCTGQGLGYATANPGATHLSGSTHAIEADSYLGQHGTRGKAHFVKFMQDLTDAVNSSIFCIQTEYSFLQENFMFKAIPMSVLRFVARNLPSLMVAATDLSDYSRIMTGLMGMKITKKDFYRIGERIFNLERYMNCLEGITRDDDTLPKRLLKEIREDGYPPIELEKMLDKYYKLRGWDGSGKPTPDLLESLDIKI